MSETAGHTTRCEATHKWWSNEVVTCQREQGHLGRHQDWSGERCHTWDSKTCGDGGAVPDAWRDQFPDTAEFVKAVQLEVWRAWIRKTVAGLVADGMRVSTLRVFGPTADVEVPELPLGERFSCGATTYEVSATSRLCATLELVL